MVLPSKGEPKCPRTIQKRNALNMLLVNANGEQKIQNDGRKSPAHQERNGSVSIAISTVKRNGFIVSPCVERFLILLAVRTAFIADTIKIGAACRLTTLMAVVSTTIAQMLAHGRIYGHFETGFVTTSKK